MPRYPELSAEELKQFEDDASGKLRVPETAREKKRTLKNKETGEETLVVMKRFRESAQIETIEVETTDTNAGDTHDVYHVTFSITATQSSGLNVGRKVFANLRINPDAWEQGDKNSGQYKMSKGSITRLTQLIRSAGFTPQGGLSSAAFAAYFPESGESPLVGREVSIEIDQYPDERSNSGWRDEVNAIYPIRQTAATAEV